jgi:hypothetical protein
MPLTMRPTGLGSGIDQDRGDYTVFCGEWNIGRIYEVREPPPPRGWVRSPNLQLGIGGARDRGRLQRMVRHALIAGGGEITSSEAYDWCFARDRSRARSQAARWSVRRVLERLAAPIGRADSIGRPWIWRAATPSAPSD